MHIRSILAVARKDTLDILANRSTLFSLLSLIGVAVLFLIIKGLLGTHTTKVLIYDPGNSGIEKVISSEFTNAQFTPAGSPDEVSAAFGPDGAHKSASYALGVVVPADFVSSLRSRGHPQINLYVNGDQINNTDRGILVRLLTGYAEGVVNPQPAHIALATINPPSTTPIGDLGGMYTAVAILMSFITGISIMPNLLIEEKEKKTLRMLMVSPATFTDVVLGKLLVGLGYQLLLSIIIASILGGFSGNVEVLLLFIVLGACFSLTLGLLAGSIFQTMSAAGGFIGIMSMLYVAPSIFVGPLGVLLGGGPIAQVLKALPMYYIAQGAYEAVQNLSTPGSVLLNGGIVVGSTVVVLAAAVWALRRQAAVAATI
jgi:ABC-2 type transport system permease protein